MDIVSQELIKGCKQNERTAMAELFRMLAPQLKGICYRYCGNTFDAEDLLQESFIVIFTRIGDFKGLGSFEGWAKRIAVNTCLNWLRKNKQFHQMYDLEQVHNLESDSQEDDLSEVNTNELIQQIAKLPDGYRVVLNLFAIEGHSHKEIAGMLGITESTSRSQYTRAKKALQHLFMKEK
jgi:RNA polymerase sigma factor (sigma-70 family)